jgi:hypothetical protein
LKDNYFIDKIKKHAIRVLTSRLKVLLILDYACTICGKLFSTQKSLTNHSSHHRGELTPFYFFTDVGHYTGLYAISLMDFLTKLRCLDTKSIDFHMKRADFQNWIRDIGGFTSLVRDLDQLMKRGLDGEALRVRLTTLLQRALQAVT